LGKKGKEPINTEEKLNENWKEKLIFKATINTRIFWRTEFKNYADGKILKKENNSVTASDFSSPPAVSPFAERQKKNLMSLSEFNLHEAVCVISVSLTPQYSQRAAWDIYYIHLSAVRILEETKWRIISKRGPLLWLILAFEQVKWTSVHCTTKFLDNGATCTTSLVSKRTFSIALKTHTLYYIHTTFRNILLFSSGEQIVS
jgi:hypothetical protein